MISYEINMHALARKINWIALESVRETIMLQRNRVKYLFLKFWFVPNENIVEIKQKKHKLASEARKNVPDAVSTGATGIFENWDICVEKVNWNTQNTIWIIRYACRYLNMIPSVKYFFSTAKRALFSARYVVNK